MKKTVRLHDLYREHLLKTLPADPNLPPLALPPVPQPFWPLLDEIFTSYNLSDREDDDARYLRFLEQRGYSVPIQYWLPTAHNQPDLYKPWLDYVNPLPAADVSLKPWTGIRYPYPFDLENFIENRFDASCIQPSMQPLLQYWRDNHPTAFQDWLNTRFSQEGATERHHLLTLFCPAVRPEDEPFLTHVVTKDRAKKVKALAEKLLLRLQPVDAAIKAQQIALVQQTFEDWDSDGIQVANAHRYTHNEQNELYYLLAWVNADTVAEAFDLTQYELLKRLDVKNFNKTALNIIARHWLSDGDAQAVQVLQHKMQNDFASNREKIWRILPSDAQHDCLLHHLSSPFKDKFPNQLSYFPSAAPLPEGKIDRETLLKTPLWQDWQNLGTTNKSWQDWLSRDMALWLPASLTAVVAEAVQASAEFDDFDDFDNKLNVIFELNEALANHSLQP